MRNYGAMDFASAAAIGIVAVCLFLWFVALWPTPPGQEPARLVDWLIAIGTIAAALIAALAAATAIYIAKRQEQERNRRRAEEQASGLAFLAGTAGALQTTLEDQLKHFQHEDFESAVRHGQEAAIEYIFDYVPTHALEQLAAFSQSFQNPNIASIARAIIDNYAVFVSNNRRALNTVRLARAKLYDRKTDREQHAALVSLALKSVASHRRNTANLLKYVLKWQATIREEAMKFGVRLEDGPKIEDVMHRQTEGPDTPHQPNIPRSI